MSVQLVSWAYSVTGLSPTQKFVLVTLANAANHHTGRCHPSIARLCEETGFAERTVRKALEEMCETGIISRTRPRRPDGSLPTYRYQFPVSSDAQPPAPVTAGPPAPPAGKEPEVDLEPEEGEPNGSPRARQRDALWDTLSNLFGEATTETARSLRGKVHRSLTAARASPEEVVIRVRAWPRHFDNCTLTELALEKHWDALGRIPLRLEEQRNGRSDLRRASGEKRAENGDQPTRVPDLLRDLPG